MVINYSEVIMTQSKSSKSLGSFVERYAFIIFFLFTFVYATFMPDWGTVWPDLKTIVLSPSLLTHDFFEVGGLAATFVNVSLHFLVGFILVTLSGDGKLKGVHVAAVGFYAGHAFFGSHILNIIPAITGVYLYSKFAGQPFHQNATLAIFSNTLGPIASILWNQGEFSPMAIIFGILVGVLAGFVSVPVAGHTAKFHSGTTLLNYGFVSGLIGIIFVTLMNIFGFPVEPVGILHSGANIYITIYLLIASVFFMLIALTDRQAIAKNYKELLSTSGVSGTDFLVLFGPQTTAFNMAVMTLLILLIVTLTGFGMNGTTIGAMFSLIAFSAAGVHPKNTLPTIVGAVVGAILTGTDIASQATILPMIFSFGLAPYTGRFGILAGMFAGFAHFTFLPRALAMHLGSILYNNGFSTGFIATFLYPIFQHILTKPKKVRQEL